VLFSGQLATKRYDGLHQQVDIHDFPPRARDANTPLPGHDKSFNCSMVRA
jgi:hypothetical protein